uniref:Bifunctional uridylyltransferase/uridylyl-removing enzyme n=1 Tax=Candidatus Berkiella aquae TaxID=295108 RepID=A0A0Q9YW99_9GAMM
MRSIKQTHEQYLQSLDSHLAPHTDILLFLQQRATWLDEILQLSWQRVGLAGESLTLIALGGYGLGRIFPGSDADILLLSPTPLSEPLEQKISLFISTIWDCGIKVGSSVRTLNDCLTDAKTDLNFYTNLLTHRFICGSNHLYQSFTPSLTSLYHFDHFLTAKIQERQARYQRFDNTEYGLEPNIKESPGGLRDIDFITWIALKKYQQADWQLLLTHDDINQMEYRRLTQASRLLWKIRYYLHLYCERKSERLYFEYQAKLADAFGCIGDNLNNKISHFMQQYYQTVSEIREITDILCQYLTEKSNHLHSLPKVTLTPYCHLIQKTLDISDSHFLQQHPAHLLHLFVLFADNDDILFFSANSLRFIREFSQSLPREKLYTPQGRRYFIEIISRYRGVFKALSLMHRLGLLSLYLPEMTPLTGQMQYDLYHLYTVDAHTLFVLRNCECLFEKMAYTTLRWSFRQKKLSLLLAFYF